MFSEHLTMKLFAVIIIVITVGATEWNASTLPKPQSLTPWVSNPDNILSDLEMDQTQQVLENLTASYAYPGCGGYEMAVVIVRSIQGRSEASTETFAKEVMDLWGVGKAACNNGIVFAVAVDDRHMYIATGLGAKKNLPNAELSKIINRMKSLMRGQAYDDAILQCVSDVAHVLSGGSFQSSIPYQYIFWAIFSLVFCGLASHSCFRQSKYRKVKNVLTQIDRERSLAKANQYQIESCAICLELFSETKGMHTRLLACGHTYHKICINEWEDTRCICPICRQPDNEGVPVPNASNYDQEFHYRVRRARHLYPDFVTEAMVSRWCFAPFYGSIANDSAFAQASPNFGGGGGGGVGGGFGGGCSMGGGGAGGGW